MFQSRNTDPQVFDVESELAWGTFQKHRVHLERDESATGSQPRAQGSQTGLNGSFIVVVGGCTPLSANPIGFMISDGQDMIVSITHSRQWISLPPPSIVNVPGAFGRSQHCCRKRNHVDAGS